MMIRYLSSMAFRAVPVIAAVLFSSCAVSNFGANTYETGIKYQAVHIDEKDKNTIYQKDGQYYVKGKLAEYERNYVLFMSPETSSNICGKIMYYKKLKDSFPERDGFYLLNIDTQWQKMNRHVVNKSTPMKDRWVEASDFNQNKAKKITSSKIDYVRCWQRPPIIVPIAKQKAWYHYPVIPAAVVAGCVDVVLSPVGLVMGTGMIITSARQSE